MGAVKVVFLFTLRCEPVHVWIPYLLLLFNYRLVEAEEEEEEEEKEEEEGEDEEEEEED